MHFSHIDSGKLPDLQSILEEWIRLNGHYGKNNGWKDCAWWANERASTGIFAAAAWMCNCIALEEFTTKKRNGKGRCDLFFTSGKNKYASEIK